MFRFRSVKSRGGEVGIPGTGDGRGGCGARGADFHHTGGYFRHEGLYPHRIYPALGDMSLKSETLALLQHLAERPGHDEVKADFRSLLIAEFGAQLHDLHFERRVPEVSGRLDGLIGRTILEAKRDLRRELADVERRMPDYLADREHEEGEPFVGIATDGKQWLVYELADGALVKIKDTQLDPDKPELFLAWLDGVVALKGSLPPDALTVRAELGQDSMAYRRVDRGLRALWNKVRSTPAEALKRQLWAELLKLVHGRDVENDALWFQHTYLVIVAKCIALAVMDLREDDPRRLLSGEAFAAAGVHGAVESDFFDWVVADPDGEALIRRIMAHVRRFRLREVDSDVLKILYESLIDRDERHGLGEYYTPDWLAAKVVRHAVQRPIEQKVLDPACGSGTFLFHAVRQFLAEAEDAGMAAQRRAVEACGMVTGVDIHPVAVIIARVTFLLALAPSLGNRTGSLSIPVYLGDSMQLSVKQDMVEKELVIQVPPPPAGGGSREKLSFPEPICAKPAVFDRAIEAMRQGSLNNRSRAQIEAQIEREAKEVLERKLEPEEQLAVRDLGETYETYHKLRVEGRDTIWSYVARNLSRPLALASGGGWANVLVGNPPWVAYRHMSADLQKRFKELAKGEKVYVGSIPSHNDLCALFVVRASSLYLRPGGNFGFVLPLAALTRAQYEKFRTGRFTSDNIRWEEAWTTDIKVGSGAIFPVPSAVAFGRKRALAKAMPDKVRCFDGNLPYRDAPEEIADLHLTVTEGADAPERAQRKGGSAYRKAFRQGAILIPRFMVLVERKQTGRLGQNLAAPLVTSKRSSQEKAPWKDVVGLEGAVESEFLHPVLLGESILPFRLFQQFEGVIPVTLQGRVLNSSSASEAGSLSLSRWLEDAEQLWQELGKGKRELAEQFDYIGQLSAQFPISSLRVVYAKAGTQPAAMIVRDRAAVIDHKLYWSAVRTEQEAHFLAVLLNSEITRAAAEGFQSRGQFGARDFDKVIWNLPIPLFDPRNPLHRKLADAGAEAEKKAHAVDLVEGEKFQRARRRIRESLIEDGIAVRIDALVEKLLGQSG